LTSLTIVSVTRRGLRHDLDNTPGAAEIIQPFDK
jgi:hypothetical protein